jgi:hypothetical protein
MTVRMDISRIDRLVMVVMHGHVTYEEIEASTKEMLAANVAHFSKIIDVIGATSDLTEDQVERIAALLRGGAEESWRGPVAIVVSSSMSGVAHDFAEITEGERPLRLFRSLRDARRWLEDIRSAETRRVGGQRGQPNERLFR